MFSGYRAQRVSRHRATVLVPAIATAITIGAVATSTSASARSVAHSATPCYTHSQAKEHLGGSQLNLLARVVTCAVKNIRLSHKVPFVTSTKLSTAAASALRADATIPVSDAGRVQTQVNAAARRYCGGPARASTFVIGDSSSADSVTTPASVASDITSLLQGGHVMVASGTAFGFAYAKHLVFDDPHTADPVSFLLIAAECR